MSDYEFPQADFEQNGLTVIREFLAADELANVKSELDRFIRDVLPGNSKAKAFYLDPSRPESLKQLHNLDTDSYFAELPGKTPWSTLAADLLNEEVVNDPAEWFNKPPASNSPTPPHQDNFYFCQTPPQVVTIWLSLDRVDDDNGCLRYVPGSHLKGVRPHSASNILGFSQQIADYGEADRHREVPIHLAPGDAVAHHGNTIHLADANRTTDRHRRALAVVYRGISCRRDEQAFARYQAAVAAQHQALGLK